MTSSVARHGGKAMPIPPQDLQQVAWDEEKLELALHRLKELHIKVGRLTCHAIQLRDLRSTIPRMIQPLTGHPYPSPDHLFTACQSSMATAMKEVKEFKDLVTSSQTKEVLDHALQSRKKNSTGITPWRPRDDPNWAVLDTKPSDS